MTKKIRLVLSKNVSIPADQNMTQVAKYVPRGAKCFNNPNLCTTSYTLYTIYTYILYMLICFILIKLHCFLYSTTFLYFSYFFYTQRTFIFHTYCTLNKPSLGETGWLINPYFLLAAQASSFLIYFSFPNTVSEDTLGTLPLTVQYLCELQNLMLLHWSPVTSYLTLT